MRYCARITNIFLRYSSNDSHYAIPFGYVFINFIFPFPKIPGHSPMERSLVIGQGGRRSSNSLGLRFRHRRRAVRPIGPTGLFGSCPQDWGERIRDHAQNMPYGYSRAAFCCAICTTSD